MTHKLEFNDYGFHNYILKSTMHGLFMRAPLPEDHNHFSVHVHPILLLVLPFVYLFNSNAVLHLIEGIVLVLGAIPLLLIARKISPNPVFHLIALFFYYGNRFIYRVFFSFHFEVFFIPLFLGFLAAVLYKRKILAGIFLALSFCCRQDYALYIGASSLAFALFDRERRHLWGMVCVWGILWFIIAQKFIVPHMYNPNKIHVGRIQAFWGQYGSTLPGVIWYFITHPIWLAKKLLLESELVKFVRSGLFFSVLSPFSIGLIPPMVMIATNPQFNGYLHYYQSSILLPFLFISSLFGLAKVGRLLERCTGLQTFFFIPLLVFSINYCFHTIKDFTSLNGFHSCLIWDSNKYYPPIERYRLADKKIQELLSGNSCSVAAGASLFPRIPWRRHLYEDRYWKQYLPYWVMFDVNRSPGNIGHEGREQAIQELKSRKDYELVFDYDGFLFFKKAPRFN